MAFIINKNKYVKNPDKYMFIADNDIVVYKFGYLDNGLFYSYNYNDYFYKPNIFSKTIIPKLFLDYDYEDNDVYNISKGYHAYSENCSAWWYDKEIIYALFADKQTGTPYKINADVGIFIIPKDCIYYQNEYGEIVSSIIMWTGKCIEPQYINHNDAVKTFKELKYEQI